MKKPIVIVGLLALAAIGGVNIQANTQNYGIKEEACRQKAQDEYYNNQETLRETLHEAEVKFTTDRDQAKREYRKKVDAFRSEFAAARADYRTGRAKAKEEFQEQRNFCEQYSQLNTDVKGTCYSDTQCPKGQICSTSIGDCRSLCEAGKTCIQVCGGICVPPDTDICKPYICKDGTEHPRCLDGRPINYVRNPCDEL